MDGRSYPLQLINVPMVVDSRQLNPASRAATEQPPNFPMYAVVHIAIVYPQMTPELSRPRLVERPERVKYCQTGELDIKTRQIGNAYKRQENDRNHVFEFLSQCDGEVPLPWDDKSNNESAYGRLSDGVVRQGYQTDQRSHGHR